MIYFKNGHLIRKLIRFISSSELDKHKFLCFTVRRSSLNYRRPVCLVRKRSKAHITLPLALRKPLYILWTTRLAQKRPNCMNSIPVIQKPPFNWQNSPCLFGVQSRSWVRFPFKTEFFFQVSSFQPLKLNRLHCDDLHIILIDFCFINGALPNNLGELIVMCRGTLLACPFLFQSCSLQMG